MNKLTLLNKHCNIRWSVQQRAVLKDGFMVAREKGEGLAESFLGVAILLVDELLSSILENRNNFLFDLL